MTIAKNQSGQAAKFLNFPDLEDIKWVVCPSCCYEWTRLRPCRFWPEPNGAPQFSHICVRCAEGVGAFPWIMQQWPSEENPAYNAKKFGEMYRIPESDLPPTAFRAYLELREKTFEITSRYGGYPVQVTYNGATQGFENSIAAWMFIRKKLREQSAPVKRGW